MTAILSVPRGPAKRQGHALLRVGDIIIAIVALLVFAPVMVILALAILYESGAPVFFRQKRLGQNGHPFWIIKFKKFGNCADSSGPHLTSRDDGRMTRIGTFLQRTKFDELPQFFNVLRGDMAIIGPRPESLRFADCFEGRYGQVLFHKPGILGPNQVLFRHEDELFAGRTDVEQYYREIVFPLKASVDLLYFPRRTVASDIRLLISAVGAICGVSLRTEHLVVRPGLDGERPDLTRPAVTRSRPVADWFSHRRSGRTELDRSGAAP